MDSRSATAPSTLPASTRWSTSSVQRGPSIGEFREEKREHGGGAARSPNLLVLEKRGDGEYGVCGSEWGGGREDEGASGCRRREVAADLRRERAAG
jgi:hypothetical protein